MYGDVWQSRGVFGFGFFFGNLFWHVAISGHEWGRPGTSRFAGPGTCTAELESFRCFTVVDCPSRDAEEAGGLNCVFWVTGDPWFSIPTCRDNTD